MPGEFDSQDEFVHPASDDDSSMQPQFDADDYDLHRPSTARPTTAGGSLADYDYHHGHVHPGAEYQIEEEYEDESEDDDVFAFLPPSTAEQQEGSQSRGPSAGLAFPSPTYNPWPEKAAEPQFGFDPGVYRHPAPQSPPSTDSQTRDDPYRMKRLNTAPASVAALPPSTNDSHPVHVSLPSSALGPHDDAYSYQDAIEKAASVASGPDIECLPHHSPHHQGRLRHGNLNSAPYSHGRSTRGNTGATNATSGVDTVSIGPSVMDDDDVDGISREGSIK